MESVLLFQAEDGIRDLVRSRGLGDVYKRQELYTALKDALETEVPGQEVSENQPIEMRFMEIMAVSYTHLTLPTSDLV